MAESAPDSQEPIVAIIGRPNVGKSALFNRLVGKRQALVDATPGLTRDRLYGRVRWQGLAFQIVDTGGLQWSEHSRLSTMIGQQVSKAMEEADMALLVCDAKAGIVPLDRQVASWARRWNKPILLVASKVDTEADTNSIHEFSALGFGAPLAVSSLHGRRVGELLDQITQKLKQIRLGNLPEERQETTLIKVAVVGRPNVGKSSLINRIVNEERVVVDETAGTTRDPVEVSFLYEGQAYNLVDTAGIRSQRKLKEKMDVVARMKALEMAQESDVCLGVLDGSAGILQDDLKLLDEVVTAGKPLCLVVNKWDLLPKADPKKIAQEIAQRAPFLRFAPVISASAKTGFHLLKVLEEARILSQRSQRQISPAQGRQLLEMIRSDPKAPSSIRSAHFFRLSQIRTSPIVYQLFARFKEGFRDSDVAYLETVLRRQLPLQGIPFRIRLLTGEKE